MAFLGGLLSGLAKPVLGALGGLVKSTIGDLAPKLAMGLAETGVQALNDKIGIETPQEKRRAPIREQIRQGISEARDTFKRKAKDQICEDELRKMRKMEREIDDLEEENERLMRMQNSRNLPFSGNEDYELQ